MKSGPNLGGAFLRAALIAGSRAVIAKRDELNRINVFPVADGDTGTNMAFTFAAVLESATAARGQGADVVLRNAAMSAVDGARGNSGAIVAQFFYSLTEALKGQSRISLAALSDAVTQAALAWICLPEVCIVFVVMALSHNLNPGLVEGIQHWL